LDANGFRFDIKNKVDDNNNIFRFYEFKSWGQFAGFNTGQFAAYLKTIDDLDNLKFLFQKRDAIQTINDIKNGVIRDLKKDKSLLGVIPSQKRIQLFNTEDLDQIILLLDNENIFKKIFKIID